MYSRYTPDGSGGHARRPMQPPAAGPVPPPGPAFPPPPPPGPPPDPPKPDRPPAVPPPRPGPVQPVRPSPPGRPPPRPLFSPGSGLFQGLLRGLDTEDLLVLAILALAMKEDGADKTVIWIAVALYLLSGGQDRPL